MDLLVEYDREITKNRMQTALNRAVAADSVLSQLPQPQAVEQLLKQAEDTDPTPNKKYTQWILTQVGKGLKYEDINEYLTQDIEFFHQLSSARKKQMGIETDINRYDWRQLAAIAAQSKKVNLDEPVDADLDYKNIKDMRVLYVGPMGQLIVPKTQPAACEIGSGTRWCTAATSSHNYFDSYHGAGPLFVWIPSRQQPEKAHSDKYQLHFETGEFRDAQDIKVPGTLLEYFRTQHPLLSKLFAKKESDMLKNDPTKAMEYARMIGIKRWTEGEAVFIKDAMLAVSYAEKILKSRWPTAESVIATSGMASFMYARDVMKGRFPKGEPAIANYRDPHAALSYAIYIINGRFPEAESNIARDAKAAVNYAQKIIKGRWPEGESEIVKDPQRAVQYAMNVVGRRVPEAEDAIARQPMSAYQYARHVVRGPWPPGEAAIAQDPHLAQEYATTILRSRFRAGEPAILQSANSAIRYVSDVLKRPWPEAEHLFVNNSRFAFVYAQTALKRRWPEAEPIIAKDALYAYNYARFIIQGRWPMGEPAMQENLLAWKHYKRFLKQIND